jgi:hypothetical protein
MKHKGDIAPFESRNWTRPEEYISALARRRTARKSRESKPRTEPEVPRLLLSTLPFFALLLAMAVLTTAIMVIAWPGSQPQPRPKLAQHEEGFAPKGWFQEAEKGFR